MSFSSIVHSALILTNIYQDILLKRLPWRLLIVMLQIISQSLWDYIIQSNNWKEWTECQAKQNASTLGAMWLPNSSVKTFSNKKNNKYNNVISNYCPMCNRDKIQMGIRMPVEPITKSGVFFPNERQTQTFSVDNEFFRGKSMREYCP